MTALGIETLSVDDLRPPGASQNSAQKSQDLKITLNSNGKMESPFSLELDENGFEVSRKELGDNAFFLPSIPRGVFETATSISSAQIPDDFKNLAQVRPFALTEAERNRITIIRQRAPELNRWIVSTLDFSNSRNRVAQVAVESFTSFKFEAMKASALTELKWIQSASFARDLNSDRTVEKRLLDTMMLWAKTYKPSGSAIDDRPLMDAAEAYGNIRHLWSSTDQNLIDGFFTGLVEAQFTRMKSHKFFDEAHAAHVRFALIVGLVTDNRALQLHGITQYKLHVERSPIFKMESFGTTEVRTLEHLLRSAYALDRSENFDYRHMNLSRAVTVLSGASQSSPKEERINTLALGAYFRPDLYPRLAALTVQTGTLNSRFGMSDGALIAALRRPTSSLDPSASGRQPSQVPTKLPPKAPRR